MDVRGPDAFAPMPKLPRNRSHPPRAIFHFSQGDSNSSDELGSSLNMLGLNVDTRNVLSNFLTDILRRGSRRCHFPLEGRRAPRHSHHLPSSGSIPRTPSTPIILSNGKSFKHSLKSSHSSPHAPGVCLHQHAQSEPATPAVGPMKNVHFAGEESLRTVRVFNASGKPVNESKQQAEDETETEPE